MKKKQLAAIFILTMLICSFTIKTAEANYRILERGMYGRAVRKLQEDLVMLGKKVMIDGIFGPSTEDAIEEFQKQSGLPADGVVGEETWTELLKAVRYENYTVRAGDTLYDLAQDYGITVEVVKKANDLDSNLIRPGQELIIPKSALGGAIVTDFYKMVPYTVQSGDSLQSLAKRFHTTVRTIKRVNNLNSNRIRIGQELTMPKLVIDLSGSSKNVRAVDKDFIWPVNGRISSDYGWRTHPILQKKDFHGGIDVAVGRGTAVKAAKAGTVLHSGWIKGFGRTVTIDHGNGVVTLYAHNSELVVRAGQYVKQGEVIAKSGNTGLSTGPHLDFRILIDSEPVNPMQYLN
ncbi:metalloendopeptidase-like membrane protein [Halobacteroides halobius DSM 5150]|uniref:Metalloendopeptidase-like membrane protein n=1 Tax=Halobacteroides halobius (strain ATCC 35273 / DSM 5150 / MD-1) TaxID=748449 RepID=L0KBV2_HALHC|nr:peptidoglycan DD-metalloendopeptidase family protein [Halobacteroides halobius]AGB41573.1 metalloendopeptidase-like membrane protein [Halobacteroides halobius DSM 5150]